MEAALFEDLPRAQILNAYTASPGDELSSGKFASPTSSDALVPNTFGFFLNEPELLPALPGMAEAGWPAQRIELEACVRFPWSGDDSTFDTGRRRRVVALQHRARIRYDVLEIGQRRERLNWAE